MQNLLRNPRVLRGMTRRVLALAAAVTATAVFAPPVHAVTKPPIKITTTRIDGAGPALAGDRVLWARNSDELSAGIATATRRSKRVGVRLAAPSSSEGVFVADIAGSAQRAAYIGAEE